MSEVREKLLAELDARRADGYESIWKVSGSGGAMLQMLTDINYLRTFVPAPSVVDGVRCGLCEEVKVDITDIDAIPHHWRYAKGKGFMPTTCLPAPSAPPATEPQQPGAKCECTEYKTCEAHEGDGRDLSTQTTRAARELIEDAVRERLVCDIASALLAEREAERERCAVIAETQWVNVSVGKVSIERQPEVERNAIAAAIRKGVTE